MTQINKSNIGIGYTEIIKKGSPQDKEAGISDNKSVIDNVIDLTNPNNITSELNQANAEFIKVSEEVYLKLDLANPDSVKKLLGDLKDNILSTDGQKVLEDFNYVNFSEESGITIQSIAQAKRITIAKPEITEKPAETSDINSEITIAEAAKSPEEIAISNLDKLAEKHPEVQELLKKFEDSKATGKSLKLMGITKLDLAIYISTGQSSPKMEEALQKAFKTGNWPAVNSTIEIARLHKTSLEDKVLEKNQLLKELSSQLDKTDNPEEKLKLNEQIANISSEINEMESAIKSDSNTLKTLPDAATRARTSVSKRAIGIFDSQLAKLKPDSPEYLKVKKLRDQEITSLKNDAISLDNRIEKAEAKGKSPDHLKGLAANVHSTTASSDISLFSLESNQKQKGAGQIASPQNPPPASELLKDAEKHIEKVEKYTPAAKDDFGVQELKLSLHHSQRQDAKDRLKATGVIYDDKTKTFKHDIPSNYQPANESVMPKSEHIFSSSEPLVTYNDDKVTTLVTDQQKEIEKEYHVAGIKTIQTVDNEKQILKAQLTQTAPADPKEAQRQLEIVKKISSLNTVSSEIKIEQTNILAESKKAENDLQTSDKTLTSREEQYNQKIKQKEGIALQIKTINEQLGEVQAEIDDWKDNYVFDNPDKQKELEKVKINGQAALTLLRQESERLDKEEETLVPSYSTEDINHGSIAEAQEKWRVSSGKNEIALSQSESLRQAYHQLKETPVNLEESVEKAQASIQEGQKVFSDAPLWIKQKPEFKVEEAKHIFNETIRQRNDLSESVELVASEKAKTQILQEPAKKDDKSSLEQKASKAGIDSGLSAKQKWDIETVKTLDSAEATRVSLKDSSELTNEQKQELTVDSVRSQISVSKNVANTIPEETLRLLGRSYETTEFEISPDVSNNRGDRPLQVDLMESIGQLAIDSVGTSFRREMSVSGQKPVDKSGVSASQNLLDFSAMIAGNLSAKNGGAETALKILETKHKWDSAIKDVSHQLDEHKDNLKKEKSLVLGAMDYHINRTKEAASGHALAGAMWYLRDSLESENQKPNDFDYEKIDLSLLDKARSGIDKKYTNQIIQISALSADVDTAIKANKGLEYLSALKLYSQSAEVDNKSGESTAKDVISKHKGPSDLILNPKISEWDPAIKSWASRGVLSERGAGIREETKNIEAQFGCLLAGGYQKELNDAKQMEAKYVGMSVTDVLGVDTKGWEIEDPNFKWLNTVGSVLNKTDTVAMIAEIALTEVLTAGLGSAVASARVAMFLEKVAVNFPKVEQAVALARSISAFAPAVLSGEKTAASAVRLLAAVAKNERTAVRTMSGMRKLEQAAEIGSKATKLKAFVRGGVHMSQAIAVPAGLTLGAQKVFGEHSMAAKFVEFGGQFLFVDSSNKISKLKDLSGKLAMNFATTYGQKYTGALVTYGIEKAMEASNGKPLSPEQKLEAKKWGERVSMAAGIVVPSLIGVMHTEKMSPEKINEFSSFNTEKLNTGLAKDSPEYKQLHSTFGEYFQESSKTNLKQLQQLVNSDKFTPESKQKAHEFIKNESAKLALQEMPKIETNDPKVYAQHIEKYLNELNGRDGLVKYDSETIHEIVAQQYVFKTMDGISKIHFDMENLNGIKGEKVALAEAKNLSDTIKMRKEQLVDKFKDVPGFDIEVAKDLMNTSTQMFMGELVKNKGLNKESLFAIAKVANETDTPLTIKLSLEEGFPAQEFTVKHAKSADGIDSIELSGEGYKTIKLNKENIDKISGDGETIQLSLKENIVPLKNETANVEEPALSVPKTSDPELNNLFKDLKFTKKEEIKKFIEGRTEDIVAYLEKNISSKNDTNILAFYNLMGGWENIKSLDGKIPSDIFNSIHKARDNKVKECWSKVEQHAKDLGFDLAPGYVGTPPSEDPKSPYKRAWSDVDFSVKIVKSPEGMSPIEIHANELKLMQMMQKELQNNFDGAPSHIVDSNAYATPLILDIGKGKPVSETLSVKDKTNQKEMDFYQIRKGFGNNESGIAAYKKFRDETLQLAKVKGEETFKSVEVGFTKAEERNSKMSEDIKSEIAKLKDKYPDKSHEVIEEMAITELRYSKENELLGFIDNPNNKVLLEEDSLAGQEKRIEFNQMAREMRALWPEAYIGDQAAKWGSSGKEMLKTFTSMSNSEKMQARISQDQFKLHWLVEASNEKDMATRLLKTAKYELRDLDFKAAMFESITGSSKNVFNVEKNTAYDHEIEQHRDNIKAYTSHDFPEQAAFKEIKDFAKNPAEAEKIWEKHFGTPPDIKGSAMKALDSYLSLTEAVTTVNLYNHITKPELK